MVGDDATPPPPTLSILAPGSRMSRKTERETWLEIASSGERCRIEGTRAVLGWGRRQGRLLQTLGFVGIPRGTPLDNFFGGWYILKVSGVALGPDRERAEGSPGGGECLQDARPEGRVQ